MLKKYITIEDLIWYHIDKIESKSKPSKTELERVAKAKSYLANKADCGRIGKAFETMFVSEKSRKKACSAQGKIDNYFYLDGKRYPVEYKINGGRIESLYGEAHPDKKYIVYALDYTVPLRERKDGSIAGGEHRVINPIIMTIKDFLEVIETLHAYKFPEHKGKGDREKAVSASSKKMYDVLKEYCVPFHPDNHYVSEDFEDLELF